MTTRSRESAALSALLLVFRFDQSAKFFGVAKAAQPRELLFVLLRQELVVVVLFRQVLADLQQAARVLEVEAGP